MDSVLTLLPLLFSDELVWVIDQMLDVFLWFVVVLVDLQSQTNSNIHLTQLQIYKKNRKNQIRTF